MRNAKNVKNESALLKTIKATLVEQQLFAPLGALATADNDGQFEALALDDRDDRLCENAHACHLGLVPESKTAGQGFMAGRPRGRAGIFTQSDDGQHRILPPDAAHPAPVVLMVSGGSDSTALARLYTQINPRGAAPVVLHVNHQLRGADAEGDQEFVQQLAEELGYRCVIHRAEVAAQAARQNANIEQIGRIIRYQAAEKLLDQLCQETGAKPEQGRIITAHTLDDRAETFLMRTIVGGGTAALAAIPYRNGRVIRPLLDCTRQELQDWLLHQPFSNKIAADKASAQSSANPNGEAPKPTTATADTAKKAASQPLSAEFWREDATNKDTQHLRAFVRHQIVPLLLQKNPDFLHTLQDTLDVLATDENFLAAQTQAKAAAYLHIDRIPPAVSATVDAALFFEHPALIRRVIRVACQAVAPAQTRLTFEQIDQIARGGHRVGFATDIAGDVTVRNVYGTLVIRQKSAEEQPAVSSALLSPHQPGHSEQSDRPERSAGDFDRETDQRPTNLAQGV